MSRILIAEDEALMALDGRTDHPADPGCNSPQDGTESPDPPPGDTDRALNRPATASSGSPTGPRARCGPNTPSSTALPAITA